MESNNTNPSENKNQSSVGKNHKKLTVAEQIIGEVLDSEALLFHDQHKEPYIAQHGNGSQILRLYSKEFATWIAWYYWKKEQKRVPRDADKEVIQTLAAHALFEGPCCQLDVRLSGNENELWYDLVDGRAVKVTKDNWHIVDTPPILFRRPQQKHQVEPERDGELELLRAYINVATDDDWLLFLVFVISAFVPNFPHPLLVLSGPQGAGKTTPMRVIKELVDPSVVQGMPLPDRIPEFVQLADHHAFLFFDNLSNMPTRMSDALARAATGDSFSKRQLFTDSDDVVYRIQKTIAVNGINQVISKPDLLDRAILIKLKRIAPDQRMPEADFWAAFKHDKAQLLGAIFDTLVKALNIYPDVEMSEVPRMADFTKWGCAIAEAAGYGQQTFIDAYKDNINRQNEEAIEASPVAKAVIEFVKDRATWQGSAEELLKALNHQFGMSSLSSSPLWPKAPEWMSRRLNDVETNLNAVGIRIEFERTPDGRKINITNDSLEAPEPEFDDEPEEEPQDPQQGMSFGDSKSAKTANS